MELLKCLFRGVALYAPILIVYLDQLLGFTPNGLYCTIPIFCLPELWVPCPRILNSFYLRDRTQVFHCIFPSLDQIYDFFQGQCQEFQILLLYNLFPLRKPTGLVLDTQSPALAIQYIFRVDTCGLKDWDCRHLCQSS